MTTRRICGFENPVCYVIPETTSRVTGAPDLYSLVAQHGSLNNVVVRLAMSRVVHAEEVVDVMREVERELRNLIDPDDWRRLLLPMQDARPVPCSTAPPVHRHASVRSGASETLISQ